GLSSEIATARCAFTCCPPSPCIRILAEWASETVGVDHGGSVVEQRLALPILRNRSIVRGQAGRSGLSPLHRPHLLETKRASASKLPCGRGLRPAPAHAHSSAPAPMSPPARSSTGYRCQQRRADVRCSD